MMIREKENEEFGFGCFPLLEALYPGEVTLPTETDLRESVTRFMRSVGGTNNRTGQTVLNAIETTTEVNKETAPQFMWPQLIDNGGIMGDEGKTLDFYTLNLKLAKMTVDCHLGIKREIESPN